VSDNRWEDFTLNELGEIRAGLAERVDAKALPDVVLNRARRLEEEISQVMRDHPQTRSYRGPGVYRDRAGGHLRVLGLARYENSGAGSTLVVAAPVECSISDNLRVFDWSYFDGRDEDGRRRFTHLALVTESEQARRLNEEKT
jgi:hypothetical protein